MATRFIIHARRARHQRGGLSFAQNSIANTSMKKSA